MADSASGLWRFLLNTGDIFHIEFLLLAECLVSICRGADDNADMAEQKGNVCKF